MGYLYSGAEGVEHDYEKAAYWYAKAADKGSLECNLALGRIYYDNKYGLMDYGKAVHYLNIARESPDAYVSGAACFLLSKCYRNGRGVPKDKEKADSLQDEASKKGYDEAMSIEHLS